MSWLRSPAVRGSNVRIGPEPGSSERSISKLERCFAQVLAGGFGAIVSDHLGALIRCGLDLHIGAAHLC